MTWIVVACAAAVIVLALRANRTTEPEPRPGEGMDPQRSLTNVPDDYVTLLASLPTEEAVVVHGLLVANGIEAAVKPDVSGMHAYTRAQPQTMSVLVSRGQADEAAGILREEGVGEAP